MDSVECITEQTDADFDLLLKKVKLFSARYKLIIARSPFDYWSRRLESKLGTTGMAFAAETAVAIGPSQTQKGIDFTIVDQIINANEAYVLNREFIKIWKSRDHNRAALNELKFLLSRLLVGLNPEPKEGDASFDYEIERMFGLARTLTTLC